MAKTKQVRMKRYLIGRRNFGSVVDITDPCYSRDVWCRKDGVKIKPGEYTCYRWMRTDEGEYSDGTPYKDTRVGILGIYFGGVIPRQEKMEYIGEIGVDAGMAGIFENKPDYTDEQWMEFCEKTEKGYAWMVDCGVCSSSGYGDGSYDVLAAKNPEGEIVALEIRYI